MRAHDGRSSPEVRPSLGRGLLCLGTFEPPKSQASLARSFPRVVARCPEALLALVGRVEDGWRAGYGDGIAEHIRRAATGDSVRVVPITPDPYRWHAAADVLVCASDNESMPRVILEAMAFGTLVVSTDVFGIPEVVEDGVTGLLCRSRDEEALAARLSDGLAAEHGEIRAAADHRVRERHDADAYAAAFRRLIDTVLSA
jgi:D-inositol-3-phosphate glycosyltransferase